MKDLLFNLAHSVREAVQPHLSRPMRKVAREAGGDPHFAIDEIAEQATCEALYKCRLHIAYLTEDRGLVTSSPAPEWLLLIDPIDGTRPTMACFESGCFSVAVAPLRRNTAGDIDSRFGDISHALVLELRSGEWFYASREEPGVSSSRGEMQPSDTAALDSMFWSLELTAHPVDELVKVYGHLIDGSVTRGAVFVFTSSSYSLTRIASGQLDAHVDIGHRIVRDNPSVLPKFLKVGRGKLVTLFTYDIAAGAFIAERSGAVVTDAYGESLHDMRLVRDKSRLDGQCSLIAAANPTLHARIMASLRFGATA